MLHIPEELSNLIDMGAIFYISHSGGKDSQAMYVELRKIVPMEQIVVVHADLGKVEWPGIQDHIRMYTPHPLNVVRANKTFLEMVEQRGKWPSASYRQCTSDLKRGPIMKFIRNDMKNRPTHFAINCMGLRAQESSSRAKKEPFSYNKKESCNSRIIRHVFDWLPIFHYTKEEVFETIEAAGEKPFWAYETNERLSCVFCIMGCINDLQHGARQNPALYKEYVELEKKIGHTMFMKKKEPISLEDYVGVKITAQSFLEVKMGRPKAYDPQKGYQYQILVMCPGDREYEHCDYAEDRKDKKHLLENYKLAYGNGFRFKTIMLPRKFWKNQFQELVWTNLYRINGT